MELYKQKFEVETLASQVSYHDITAQIRQAVSESEIREGLITVLTAHTTCSIFLEEYVHDKNEEGEDFLQADLNRVLDHIIPPHKAPYRLPMIVT